MKKRSETNVSSLHLWKQIRIVRGTDDEKTRVYVLKKKHIPQKVKCNRMVSSGYKSFKNCEQTILQSNNDFHEKLLFETKDFLGCFPLKNGYLGDEKMNERGK